MNTNNLKRFAKEARIKLLDQIGRKLAFVLSADTAELRGKQREIDQLKKKIAEQGKEQMIETVAYTWFNRLMALRFMDANGYNIPKVITPLPGMSQPEVLQNALGGNVEPALNLDRQRLNDLLDGKTAVADAQTEAYKMLLVASCNQWHTAMPFMFERISDYTELLLPDDLLSDYSIVADIRNGMSEEDCQQEEILGWLYQFYIADKKNDVFEALKRNIKITAKNIPAATQLFTPRWIVRYMVENTLGKLWLSLRPNSKLRDHMPYYIEAPEGNVPTPIPEDLLTNNNHQLATKLTFLDPCQGSGHVLVYAFDLFTKIYEEEGYNTNEIPALILEHNLFGIDIDERAAQLAAFSLTMKSRKYYPRFLRKPVQPNVIELENVNEETIQQSVKLPLKINGKEIAEYKDLSLQLLTQADNFGSLIQIDPEELKTLSIQNGSIWQEQQQKLKVQAEYLSRQYHCVVTNPPYMGGKGMNDQLKTLLMQKFAPGKSDLFAAFILRCQKFIPINGFAGMVTMESWMFLSSFEELRSQLVEKTSIHSLSHFGWHVMRIAFGTCSFVIQKSTPDKNFIGVYNYLELEDIDRASEMPYFFPVKNNGRFRSIQQSDLRKLPGSPIGYWLSRNMISLFSGKKVGDVAYSDGKNVTGENDVYLKFIWEVNAEKIGIGRKWLLMTKGGDFRRWYGNTLNVVNWSVEARHHYKKSKIGRIIPEYLWYLNGITWSKIASGKPSFRILRNDSTFDEVNITLSDENKFQILLALLNSKISIEVLKVLNPTFSFQTENILSIPYIEIDDHKIMDSKVSYIIGISKSDWDSKELSIDFRENEIIRWHKKRLKECFDTYQAFWAENFYEFHRNEEELNLQFIEIYGLQDELTPDVPLKEITILQEESKIVNGELFIDPVPVLLQLVSYSIGCLFGRYSLDKPGLILANQGETLQDFLKEVPNPTFLPDEDNIIPILDGEWFNDDIVGRFKVFLKAAFGEEHFDENLKYLEETIGKDIRKYFVKDFYNDHIKRYKKRPIYWMFSSQKGHFKALIYMHRYQPDVCSKMLNDYLQAYISKLEAAKQTQTMLSLREDISAREKTLAIKETDKYEAMLKDCRDYAKTLFTIATQKINIDLDDGVKVNYQKFKEVLVPIQGLEKEKE